MVSLTSLKFVALSLLLGANAQNVTTKLELAHMKNTVNKLIENTLNTTIIWDRLAEMSDLYGHRITGSKALEDSIDWIIKEMKKDGLKVHTQAVKADHWKRNCESLTFHSPTRGNVKMDILGLGMSKATPSRGISAEVISIRNWEEHKEKGEKGLFKGKIVLCNQPWSGYGAGSEVRAYCAQRSEKYGAVAALVRSVTPFSIDTPHTGAMEECGIPSAAITTEDAEMLHRIQTRAENDPKSLFKKPRVTLKMAATLTRKTVKTRNIIAELEGTSKKDEIVVMSGHIDSWDMGVGVMDDAAGVFVTWEAMRQMILLGIKPKRTIRCIVWVNEEAGTAGGQAYYDANKNNLEKHVLMMESDFGTFDPRGLGFTGNPEAFKMLSTMGSELLGHTTFGDVHYDEYDEDIRFFCERGVPCVSLVSKDPLDVSRDYFVFHHTKGDRMEVLDPKELAKCSAMTAGFIYAVADVEEALPKNLLPEPKA